MDLNIGIKISNNLMNEDTKVKPKQNNFMKTSSLILTKLD